MPLPQAKPHIHTIHMNSRLTAASGTLAPMSTHTLGLPPLVSQSVAAAWMRLDRSRLSQLKSGGFPQPLPSAMLHAIVGPTRTTNVWTRDAVVHWAQNCRPVPRYPNDLPIPLFPLDSNPLAGQPWHHVADGSAEIGDGVTVGWRVLDCHRSILVHAFGTTDLESHVLGDALGPNRLVSTHFLRVITSALANVIAVPEFFTVLISTPSSTGGTVVAVTGSIADRLDAQSTDPVAGSVWAVGRSLDDVPNVAETLGYQLPWFDDGAGESVSLWTPGRAIPVAVVDRDALFVHQAAWWLTSTHGSPLEAAVGVVARAAAARVRSRYTAADIPRGWSAVTDLALPELGVTSGTDSAHTVSQAIARLRDDGAGEGLPPHLVSYASALADRQFVRIPLRSLPASFLGAAETPNGSLQLLASGDADDHLQIALSDIGTPPNVPVVAEMPVSAQLGTTDGSATVALHVDNTLSVTASTFDGR